MVINSDQDQFACQSDTDPGMNSNIIVLILNFMTNDTNRSLFCSSVQWLSI